MKSKVLIVLCAMISAVGPAAADSASTIKNVTNIYDLATRVVTDVWTFLGNGAPQVQRNDKAAASAAVLPSEGEADCKVDADNGKFPPVYFDLNISAPTFAAFLNKRVFSFPGQAPESHGPDLTVPFKLEWKGAACPTKPGTKFLIDSSLSPAQVHVGFLNTVTLDIQTPKGAMLINEKTIDKVKIDYASMRFHLELGLDKRIWIDKKIASNLKLIDVTVDADGGCKITGPAESVKLKPVDGKKGCVLQLDPGK